MACICVYALFCLCVCVCVCACATVYEQGKHFDIPMSVSSGAKSVGGSDQIHAGSFQALTVLFSIHLSPLLSSPLPRFSSLFTYTLTSPAFPHIFPALSLSLSLALLSITLYFHHILSFHVDGGCSWIYGFPHGGALFWGRPKMISQPAVWNMSLWRKRVGAQSTRQLFGSGPFSLTEGVVHLK